MNNEDSFLGLVLDAQEIRLLGKMGEAPLDRDYVFAVCDGLGGAKAGEFASRIAVDKITKMLPKYLSEKKLPREEEISKTTALLRQEDLGRRYFLFLRRNEYRQSRRVCR